MKFNQIIIALSFTFIFTNCTQSSESSNNSEDETSEIPKEEQIEKSLYDDVMKVHDEMMPKMEDMMATKGVLIELSDSLSEAGAQNIEIYNKAIEKIEIADKSMMNWMHQFEPNMDSLSHEERVNYLTSQKAKMDSVKLLMSEALDNGKSLMSN